MSLLNVSLHSTLATALVAVSVAVAAEARMYRGYEMPSYVVSQAEGDFEIRSYGPQLLAEVTVRGDRSTAVNRGFRALAGFIFGGNAEGQKVDMTVPVAQTEDANGDGTWTVQFMMPSEFSSETLPKPENSAIRFVETAPSQQVVVRFSGRWSDEKLAKKQDALRQWAEKQGLSLATGPRFYFYDSPFTLPFNRRNEVAFVVD